MDMELRKQPIWNKSKNQNKLLNDIHQFILPKEEI